MVPEHLPTTALQRQETNTAMMTAGMTRSLTSSEEGKGAHVPPLSALPFPPPSSSPSTASSAFAPIAAYTASSFSSSLSSALLSTSLAPVTLPQPSTTTFSSSSSPPTTTTTTTSSAFAALSPPPAMVAVTDMPSAEAADVAHVEALAAVILKDRLAGNALQTPEALLPLVRASWGSSKQVVIDVFSDTPSAVLLESWTVALVDGQAAGRGDLKTIVRSLLCFSKFHAWRRQGQGNLSAVRVAVPKPAARLSFGDESFGTQDTPSVPLPGSPGCTVMVSVRSLTRPIQEILPNIAAVAPAPTLTSTTTSSSASTTTTTSPSSTSSSSCPHPPSDVLSMSLPGSNAVTIAGGKLATLKLAALGRSSSVSGPKARPGASSPDPRKRMIPDPNSTTSIPSSSSSSSVSSSAPVPISSSSSPAGGSAPITIPRRSRLGNSADHASCTPATPHQLQAARNPRHSSEQPQPAFLLADGRIAPSPPARGAVDYRGIFISPPQLMFSPHRPPPGFARSVSRTPPTPFLISLEESLMAGRLPSTSANPVQGFMAEIAASGAGTSSPRLRLPLTATYYNLPDEEAPSPYVGMIDLRQELQHERHPGMYRVPTAGLLQVMICNPERTGIKVFLVKYDLRAMPPNTHTFLRQRTFVSASPHIRGPLRYAIHLRFVSSKRGHIYLHRDIRVIFSHRAPDVTDHQQTTLDGPTDPVFAPCDSLRGSPSKAQDADQHPHPQPHLRHNSLDKFHSPSSSSSHTATSTPTHSHNHVRRHRKSKPTSPESISRSSRQGDREDADDSGIQLSSPPNGSDEGEDGRAGRIKQEVIGRRGGGGRDEEGEGEGEESVQVERGMAAMVARLALSQ